MKQKRKQKAAIIITALLILFSIAACSNIVLEASGDKKDSDSQSDMDYGWLHTSGNRIYTQNGSVWYGRGVNIHDTRSNWEAAYGEPNVDLVKAHIDAAVDVWGADFLRLCLETDPSVANYGGPQYRGVLDDPGYLEDVIEIIDYIGTKQNVYVLMSLWIEPSVDSYGRPTDDTIPVWECLAEALKDRPQVMYGIINEPHGPASGNADLLAVYNRIVAAIRAVEDANGTPHHLIAVQGMQGYSRELYYYQDHPITAGGGENIIYEAHIYNPASEFQKMVVGPSQDLPMIIGEYGPAYMSIDDCGELFELAQELKIPLAAWSFHSTARPCLLEYYGKPESVSPTGRLTPTLVWGNFMKALLSSDYESPAFSELSVSPDSVFRTSASEITITASVKDLEGSVSRVYADLSPIGGGSNVSLAKGTGDTYSASVTLNSEQSAGEYPVIVSAVDDDGNVKHRSCVVTVIEKATSDLVVYADGTDIRVWPWGSTEDTSVYKDGAESLFLSYNFTNYWAGFGFNLTSEGEGYNLAGYGSLQFAYKLVTASSVPVSVVIEDVSGNKSPAVTAGGASGDFTVVNIPLTSFTGISLSKVKSIMIQLCDGTTVSASGSLWVDGIKIKP